MRRSGIGLVVLLAALLLGGWAEAQSCDGCGIGYHAPGGPSGLSSSGTAITSTVPILLPDGTAAAPSLSWANDPDTGFYKAGLDFIDISLAGTVRYRATASGFAGLSLQTLSGWGGLTLSTDVVLTRDAANTLALRNGTNAQAFNVYNTYTDASNYERLEIKWTGNEAYVATAQAGTGSARTLRLGNTANGFWEINSAISLYPGANDGYSLGTTAKVIKDVYLSRSIQGSKTKALTAGAATTVATVAVPQTAGANFAAGEVKYTVYATDTTDTQTLNGVALFSAINKAGTETCTIEDNQITDEASSSGTLACTIACATGLTDVVGITLDCASSLTETTLNALVRFDMQQPNTLTFP